MGRKTRATLIPILGVLLVLTLLSPILARPTLLPVQGPNELARALPDTSLTINALDRRAYIDCSELKVFGWNQRQSNGLAAASPACLAASAGFAAAGSPTGSWLSAVASGITGLLWFFGEVVGGGSGNVDGQVTSARRSLLGDNVVGNLLTALEVQPGGWTHPQLLDFGYTHLGQTSGGFGASYKLTITGIAVGLTLGNQTSDGSNVKRDSGGNTAGAGNDYISVHADYDNDYRSYYYDNSDQDWEGFAQTVWDNTVDCEYYNNGCYETPGCDQSSMTCNAYGTCFVPQDTQGNSVWAGTLATNADASNSQYNCDYWDMQMTGNFQSSKR